MKAAVLALQGAFIEHEQVLQRLGVETVEIRQLKDWTEFMSPSPLGGVRGRLCRLLILPGGESTVQMRLLRELGLFEPIRQAIAAIWVPCISVFVVMLMAVNWVVSTPQVLLMV